MRDCTEILSPMETRRPGNLTELVRGNERQLVEELTPVVRRQGVALDLAAVERIDAAGIAALISLYRAAHECGHAFTILDPAPHVRELLALVGLDSILLLHDTEGMDAAEYTRFSGFDYTCNAA
jgi:anti-anti-sigma factor